MSIWEKLGFGGYRGFSREAEQLLQQAVELAGSFGCSQADTGHLLLAMLQQEQGAAARFLNSRHISEQAVRRQLAENRRGPVQHLDRHAMAPDLRRTMDYALIGAQNAHVSRAEPEHLLCAMLEDDGCTAGLLLASMGGPLTEAVREPPEEQPLSGGGAGCGQDCVGRGTGPAHRKGAGAPCLAGQAAAGAGYGQPGSGHQVPGRF